MSTDRHSPIPITRPERLNSWKEIAEYLRVSVRTAQRWERREQLPVHRHHHEADSTVYANRVEVDAWLITRLAGSGVKPAHAGTGRFRLARWAALALPAACLVYAVMVIADGGHPDLSPDYRLVDDAVHGSGIMNPGKVPVVPDAFGFQLAPYGQGAPGGPAVG